MVSLRRTLAVAVLSAAIGVGIGFLGEAARAAEVSSLPLTLTFDDLTVKLENKVPLLTARVRGFLGKRIQMTGFIDPSCPFEKDVKRFFLVRDNQRNTAAFPQQLGDVVFVEMAPGKAIDFSVAPITVVGILTYREQVDSRNRIVCIYHVAAESVNSHVAASQR